MFSLRTFDQRKQQYSKGSFRFHRHRLSYIDAWTGSLNDTQTHDCYWETGCPDTLMLGEVKCSLTSWLLFEKGSAALGLQADSQNHAPALLTGPYRGCLCTVEIGGTAVEKHSAVIKLLVQVLPDSRKFLIFVPTICVHHVWMVL